MAKQCKFDSKNSRGICRCGAPQGKCQEPYRSDEYVCSNKPELKAKP